MLVAHILYPVEVLGPGKRIGIWLCGCRRRCSGCISPQLQAFDQSKNISVQGLLTMVNSIRCKYPVEGIIISGGEPFEQEEELAEFLKNLKGEIADVLVYSGYTYEQLMKYGSEATRTILENVAVLIDGEYREELNQGHPLKGSENQRIHYLNLKYRDNYEAYINSALGKKRIQNFAVRDGVFSVGIRELQFEQKFFHRMEEKGIMKRKETGDE